MLTKKNKRKFDNQEFVRTLQNFLNYASEQVKEDKYDIEAEKQNLYRNYNVTEREFQRYVKYKRSRQC